MDIFQQNFRSDIFLFQNLAVAETFKGPGIQDLVSPAGTCGKGNEEIRFFQGAEFTDSIGACTGNYNIGKGKQIGEFLFDLFILDITFGSLQFGIQFAFSA